MRPAVASVMEQYIQYEVDIAGSRLAYFRYSILSNQNAEASASTEDSRVPDFVKTTNWFSCRVEASSQWRLRMDFGDSESSAE